jgi:hypothetical protein
MDGQDVLNNMRGIGWTWGKDVPLPENPRASQSKVSFTFTILVNILRDILIFDIVHTSMTTLNPSAFTPGSGGSVFDSQLSPLKRYIVSSLTTALFGLTAYHAIDCAYQFGALATFLMPFLPDRDPALWPPLSEKPWQATSVAMFWSRCWHQWIRRSLVVVGARPLGYIAGRAGAVMGAFAVSELLHDLGMWGLGGDVEWPGFFLAMGLGVVLEEGWRKLTGKRVSGLVGRLWAAAWVIGWGNVLVDAWLRRGLVQGSASGVPEGLRLVKRIFEIVS